MKKLINFIFVIIAILFSSCQNEVKKDINALLGDNFKVSDVKSVTINDDFFTYTNDCEKMIEKKVELSEKVKEYEKSIGKVQSNINYHKWQMENLYNKNSSYSWEKKYYNEAKTNYNKDIQELEENKNQLKFYTDSLTIYTDSLNFLGNTKQVGKLYVAKYKVKNEYTKKYLDFNAYNVYAYNIDGTLHEVNKEKMQIVYSVFPNAKNDMKKAMDYFTSVAIDTLLN